MKNRFDLEDAMSALYKYGWRYRCNFTFFLMDAKVRPTEDDIANMLIGAKALHNARYQKMWQIFEDLIKMELSQIRMLTKLISPIMMTEQWQ